MVVSDFSPLCYIIIYVKNIGPLKLYKSYKSLRFLMHGSKVCSRNLVPVYLAASNTLEVCFQSFAETSIINKKEKLSN